MACLDPWRCLPGGQADRWTRVEGLLPRAGRPLRYGEGMGQRDVVAAAVEKQGDQQGGGKAVHRRGDYPPGFPRRESKDQGRTSTTPIIRPTSKSSGRPDARGQGAPLQNDGADGFGLPLIIQLPSYRDFPAAPMSSRISSRSFSASSSSWVRWLMPLSEAYWRL